MLDQMIIFLTKNVDFYKLFVSEAMGGNGSQDGELVPEQGAGHCHQTMKNEMRSSAVLSLLRPNFEIFLILKWPFSVNYSQGGIFLKFYDIYCVGNNIFMLYDTELQNEEIFLHNLVSNIFALMTGNHRREVATQNQFSCCFLLLCFKNS